MNGKPGLGSPRTLWAPGTLNLREPRLVNPGKLMRQLKIKGPKAKAMMLPKVVPVRNLMRAPGLKPAALPDWRFR